MENWSPGPQWSVGLPHLTVQSHLHCADLSSVLIDAEELRAALLQDGEPEGCIVCLWVVGICGLSPGDKGAWGMTERQKHLRTMTAVELRSTQPHSAISTHTPIPPCISGQPWGRQATPWGCNDQVL